MKTKIIFLIGIMGFIGGLVVDVKIVSAANYYHANGGSYWSQSGPDWTTTSNDGYCVSGRGPCGSSLWYFQSNMNHGGCGYDAYGNWTMAQIVAANGVTSAWIDGVGGGTMIGAAYDISYNFGSISSLTINQNSYWEEFAPLATLYRTAAVTLYDGWGPSYSCNSSTGYRVEFDEIKLEV